MIESEPDIRTALAGMGIDYERWSLDRVPPIRRDLIKRGGEAHGALFVEGSLAVDIASRRVEKVSDNQTFFFLRY